MGKLSSLFHIRDKPQNRTVGSGYAFYMGGTTSGKVVTERSAMQMTAVYSCVRILAEAIAGLPLHLYRYRDDGGKEKAIDHPLYLLLHDEPNPEMSSFVFRETLMTHLLLWGNAYAQIIRNGKGEVVALYPLMPNKMSVDRDQDGHLYYTYQRSSEEAPISEGAKVIAETTEEIERVLTRNKALIREQAVTGMPAEEFDRIAAVLNEQYKAAEKKLSQLKAEREDHLSRSKDIRRFLEALESQSSSLNDWNEQAWNLLVSQVIIQADGRAVFLFRGEIEIMVRAE